MTVDYKTYRDDKMAFVKKHDHDFHVDTSPMDDYGIYYKTYIFEDGAIWYERIAPAVVEEEIEVRRCKVNVKVKLLEVEFWSTEAGSKTYYEEF